jgi:tripeptidyl-peptidase-1
MLVGRHLFCGIELILAVLLAACDAYSLPAHVASHIDIITPTVQPNIKLASAPIGAPPQKKRAAPAPKPPLPAGCDEELTPACIRSLYNITYVPKATGQNSFGIGKCF